MTNGRNNHDTEQLRWANVQLRQRLAALQATVREKERAEASMRASRAREAHIKQVLLAIRNVNQLIVQENARNVSSSVPVPPSPRRSAIILPGSCSCPKAPPPRPWPLFPAPTSPSAPSIKACYAAN